MRYSKEAPPIPINPFIDSASVEAVLDWFNVLAWPRRNSFAPIKTPIDSREKERLALAIFLDKQAALASANAIQSTSSKSVLAVEASTLCS
jgi:hypothetical protein